MLSSWRYAMARKASVSPEEVRRARQLRDQATTITDYRKALSVILVAECAFDADQAAAVLGTSRRTIFRNRSNICSQDVTPKKTWGGRRNSSLTIEEEREFLSQWKEKAVAGEVLTVPPIHAALVERLGHHTHMSTTYRLLARHGWRKVRPDTRHPKGDPANQDEFEKNYPKRWLPPP
jgi:transposase